MVRLLSCLLALGLAASAHAEIPEVADAPAAAVARIEYRAEWEQVLRDERSQQVARLTSYYNQGAFPQNPGVAGFSHQFVDSQGQLCAVASLIWQSGRQDLVLETSRLKNDTVVSDVQTGPLADWILTSGLTREELAIIQEPGFNELTQSFTGGMELVTVAETAEQKRIRAHLLVVLQMLAADTEMSLATAVDRLGERIFTPPTTSAQQFVQRL